MPGSPAKPAVIICFLFFSQVSVAQHENIPLEANEGYLLVAIAFTGLYYNKLTIEGGKSRGVAHEFEGKDRRGPIDYQIIKLPAGKYYWRKVYLSGVNTYFRLEKYAFPMTVKAGYLNYGGMFVGEPYGSKSGSFKILNRVTPAIDFVEECCEQLLKKHPFRYGAPGVDPFVNLYFSLPQTPDSDAQQDSTNSDLSETIVAKLAATFFKRSAIEQPKISPNGQLVLLYETTDGLRELVVIKPGTSIRLSVLTEKRGDKYTSRSIHRASWVDDEYIIFTYRYGGTERMALGRVIFKNQSPTRVKTRTLGHDWKLIDPLPNLEKRALIVRYEELIPTLHEIDVTDIDKSMSNSTDVRLQKKLRASSSWLIDATGRVRAAIEYNHKKNQKILWYRTSKSKKWLAAWRGAPSIRIVPILAALDEETLIVISDEFSENSVLTTYNRRSKQYGDVIYAVPGKDIFRAFVDPSKSKVVSVNTVEDGLVQTHYLDHSKDQYPQLLNHDLFGRSPYVIQQSLDERFAVIRTSTIDDPGAFYFLDTKNDVTHKIGKLTPWLFKFRLGSSQILSTKTEDGLTIESFLTLPDIESYPKPPLIVIPHGGPISVRDTQHFNSEIQLFSTLGYAVLQTNYRGSGGYGKSFQTRGHRQWGRHIENDIDAALNTVLSLGVIDPNKICIYGGSYGGYSALISAIQRPEKYKCAASFAGVTDMTLLFHEFGVNHSNLIRASVVRIVGDPDADLESLLQYSPIYHVDKISMPVFVAHGSKDETVDLEHFYRMRKMLEYYSVTAEFLVLENEGHGFAYVDSTALFYSRLDAFLRKSLALPEPQLDLILHDGEHWPELSAAN